MTDDISGKRLLILGGVKPACEIVREAGRLQIETWVTDYLADSPAKQIADRSAMVSATDVDEVAALCRQEHIDGIITGYVDMLLPYYQKVCEKLSLPCCGTADSIEMCVDKQKFKEACERSGIPVVPWTEIDAADAQSAVLSLPMPAVVKPADSSGSRGVRKCYEPGKLLSCINDALAYSKCGRVLIERMMEPQREFSVYYMMDGTNCYLTGMGDRYVNVIDDTIAPVGKGMLFPSIYLDEWIEQMDAVVRRFLLDNGMRYGFVFLQGFFEAGQFYLHEIGYRLNGGFSYRLTEYFSHYNQIEELIRYALTGNMRTKELEKSNAKYDGFGMIVTISLKAGTIGAVSGVKEIERDPNVICVYQLHDIGDTLSAHGTTAQVFAYILCAAEDAQQIKKTVRTIRDNLNVSDQEGRSLLNEILDPDEIQFGGNE